MTPSILSVVIVIVIAVVVVCCTTLLCLYHSFIERRSTNLLLRMMKAASAICVPTTRFSLSAVLLVIGMIVTKMMPAKPHTRRSRGGMGGGPREHGVGSMIVGDNNNLY